METARTLQQKSVQIVRLLNKYGGIATGKAFMKIAGIDCGSFRLPLTNMTDEMFENFVVDVQKLGLYDLLSKK